MRSVLTSKQSFATLPAEVMKNTVKKAKMLIGVMVIVSVAMNIDTITPRPARKLFVGRIISRYGFIYLFLFLFLYIL